MKEVGLEVQERVGQGPGYSVTLPTPAFQSPFPPCLSPITPGSQGTHLPLQLQADALVVLKLGIFLCVRREAPFQVVSGKGSWCPPPSHPCLWALPTHCSSSRTGDMSLLCSLQPLCRYSISRLLTEKENFLLLTPVEGAAVVWPS